MTNFKNLSYMMFDKSKLLHIYDMKGNIINYVFSSQEGAYLAMQDDGNLVLRAKDKTSALWNLQWTT